MSRTKRIEKKVAFLGNRIEEMTGREKVNFALDLAKEITVAPTKSKVEAVLDKYIRDSQHITITFRNREAAKPDRVEYIMLMRDENRNPVAEAKRGNVYYDFPLTTGMEIHTCNEFLCSLDLGIDIHFETYSQYGMLLMECSELLEKKKPLA